MTRPIRKSLGAQVGLMSINTQVFTAKSWVVVERMSERLRLGGNTAHAN